MMKASAALPPVRFSVLENLVWLLSVPPSGPDRFQVLAALGPNSRSLPAPPSNDQSPPPVTAWIVSVSSPSPPLIVRAPSDAGSSAPTVIVSLPPPALIVRLRSEAASRKTWLSPHEHVTWNVWAVGR